MGELFNYLIDFISLLIIVECEVIVFQLLFALDLEFQSDIFELIPPFVELSNLTKLDYFDVFGVDLE